MDIISGISSTSEMRKSNYSSVYRVVYKEQQISKQAIAAKLHMSLPTVSQYLKELEESGLIEKSGHYVSTGGRKPNILQPVATARVAAGLEIRNDMARLNLLDLQGALLKESIFTVSFSKTSEYYDELCSWVNDTIASMEFNQKQILGIGIGIQNIISPDGQETIFGKLLPAGILISDFSSRLNYHCVMVHDVELAALAELWYRPDLKNVIYLSLNHNLGGALIVNGRIHSGMYSSGTIEHMVYIPNGLPCYCGKNGCL
ncbi:MAG: ROK family transcriptional regulator, partial [Oscillospiraceae bacterium]